MWRKGNPFALLVGMQIGAATVESSMEIPQTIKNCLSSEKLDLSFDPAIPLLGIYLKEPKTLIKNNIKHSYVHRSIIYNHQDMEAAHVPISRRVDKTTVVHLPNGILRGHRIEENFTLCNSMDGSGEHYAK